MSIRTLCIALAFARLLLAATDARAAILEYTFHGVAGAGSSLRSGTQQVDLSGVAYTAHGSTIDDIDLFSGGAVGDGVGSFAATTTYDFGALGTFVTDVGKDHYVQGGTPKFVFGAGLYDDAQASGPGIVARRFVDHIVVPGDPDSGVPLGTVAVDQSTVGVASCRDYTRLNAAGQVLEFRCSDNYFTGLTVTAAGSTAVSAPATTVLMALGLLYMGLCQRRRKHCRPWRTHCRNGPRRLYRTPPEFTPALPAIASRGSACVMHPQGVAHRQ